MDLGLFFGFLRRIAPLFAEKKREIAQIQLLWNRLSILGQAPRIIMLLVLLSGISFAKKEEKNLIKLADIYINKNDYYLVNLKNITAELEISLFCNNKFVFKQNTLIEKATFDDLFINSQNHKRQCSIFVSPLLNIKLKTLPLINTKIVKSDSEIEYYKGLYEIRMLWSDSNKNTGKILNIIEENLTRTITANQKEELMVYKLAILYNAQRNQDVINVSRTLDLSTLKNFRNKIYIKWYWAQASLNAANYEASIKLFQSIYTELNNQNKLTLSWKLFKIRALAHIGLAKSVQLYFDKFHKDNGKESIEIAIKEFSKLRNKQLLAETLYFYGVYFSATEEWNQSLATLEVAEKITKETEDADALILIYNQTGIAYSKLGQIKKSIDSFRSAFKIAFKTNSISKYQYLFSNIASMYEKLGNFHQSKRYYKKYLKQLPDNNLLDKYSTFTKLGRILSIQNKVNQAIDYHLKSKNFYKGKEQNTFIDVISELSIDYQKKEDFNQAENFAFQVLLLSNFEVLDFKQRLRLGINTDLGFWKNVDSIANKSTSNLKFILSNNRIDFQTEQQIKALLVLAKIAMKNGTKTELKTLLQTIESGLNLLPINHQLEYYQLKTNYLQSEKKYNELTSVVQNAFELIDKTRKKLDVSKLALYWTHQAKTILDRYINALILQKKYKEIYEVLEKYYAINLRGERLNSTYKIINNKSKDLQVALNRYLTLERETLLTDDVAIKNKTDVAQEHFLALKGDDNQVSDKTELKSLTLKQVQEKLGHKELFLRYYTNATHAFVFIIDKESYSVMQLPDKLKLHQIVKSIISNIKSKRFNKLTSQNDLFAQILPQEKILSGRYDQLIIIPDGILNLLPFSALNISLQDDKYLPLVNELSIERTYSASDYFAKIAIPADKNSISIFANPIFLQGSNKIKLQTNIAKDSRLWQFTPLPYTQQEAQYIQQIFPDVRINLMSGVNATNANLLSERTRNSNIIHIATHGFFNDKDLENVGLATTIVDKNNLSAPGVLAMREILYQPFKANLAVISGCETTLGKEISSEGFNSLSRGLLSQGVNAVIGTIWSISDRATPIFMQEFYRNLKEMNGNVAKALNKSKVNFVTQARFRRYRHPYYWAGFVLTSSNKGVSEGIFN